uniref:Uncharacterized protein n=1 Tax=Anguilla anguilla TaxID=7936 RepID=A0A0E9QII6_ANGAN
MFQFVESMILGSKLSRNFCSLSNSTLFLNSPDDLY